MKLFSPFSPVTWISVAVTIAPILSHMRVSSVSLGTLLGEFAQAGVANGSTQSAAAAGPEPARLASSGEKGEVDVAFSPHPEGSAQRLVIKVIDAAQHSIEIAAYEFTSKPIADALIRAAGRGVKVYLVADARENDPGRGASRVSYVADGGVSARVDDVYPIMHHKFIVVDEETVETGSFNYTHAAAAANAENVVVLWRRPEIGSAYVKRFQELWDESRPVGR
jgi:phosphatidylserine/phosphatidylglycerophosphate/cardiolipin synthase-like enzyme